jgi:hypothetical protein
VAAWALPRHAMVVFPGHRVSVSPPLLFSMSSWNLLCALLELALLSWSLLCSGHAYLELALAKLTWSLLWPCCPLSAALGFLPKLALVL